MVSIKLRIMNKGKIVDKRLISTLQDFEDRITALEGADSEASSQEGTPSQNETPAAATTRDISFTINDGTGPVASATVAIGNVSGTTGSAGGCTLQAIADGEQTVTVTADGYTTKTETITVSEANTTFTISLTASG